jgi:hypothetical protein
MEVRTIDLKGHIRNRTSIEFLRAEVPVGQYYVSSVVAFTLNKDGQQHLPFSPCRVIFFTPPVSV